MTHSVGSYMRSVLSLRRAGLIGCLLLAASAASAQQAQLERRDPPPVVQDPNQFIQKNLDATRRKLEQLKGDFRNCCGSPLLQGAGRTNQEITESLPPPKQLRYQVDLPELDFDELLTDVQGGEASALAESDALMASTLNLRAALLGPFFSGGARTFAADANTAAALSIPQNVGLRLSGSFMGAMRPVERRDCCASVSVTVNENGTRSVTCTRFHESPPLRRFNVDPRAAAKLGKAALTVNTTPGASLQGGGTHIKFTRPGEHEVNYSIPAFNSRESLKSVHQCDGDFSRTVSVPNEYAPVGTIERSLKFQAISVAGFGIPGLDFPSTDGEEAPTFDLLFAARTPKLGGISSGIGLGALRASLLVDYGAGERRIQSAQGFNAATRYLLSGGPFALGGGQGQLRYLGGFGETEVTMELGGGIFQAKHTLRASVIDVVVDERLRNRRTASGAGYPVEVIVKGPVDLADFSIEWSGDMGWQVGTTRFESAGEDLWRASNVALPRGDTGTRQEMLAEFKDTRNDSVRARWRAVTTITQPAFGGLQLYIAGPGETPRPVDETLDLFAPNEIPGANAAELVPMLDGPGGLQVLTEVQVSGATPKVELVASAPSVVSARASGRGFNVQAVSPEGESTFVARIGGADLDTRQLLNFAGTATQLESDTVRVTANRLLLTRDATGYRLHAIGGADMSRYRAVWSVDGARRSSPFMPQGEGFVSRLDIEGKTASVEVRSGNRVAARLSSSGAIETAEVKLLPTPAPATTVRKVTLVDGSDVETIADCRNQLLTDAEGLGIVNRSLATEICRGSRDVQKQEIKDLRENQKRQNELVDQLEDRGEALVILADSVQVGAAVKQIPNSLLGSVSCRWSLLGDSSMRLVDELTVIQKANAGEGACFNRVEGIATGFDPQTQVKVDLVLTVGNPGQPRIGAAPRVVR